MEVLGEENVSFNNRASRESSSNKVLGMRATSSEPIVVSEVDEGITGISNKSKPHLIHVLEENEEAEQETQGKRQSYDESPALTLEPKMKSIDNDIAQ